MDASTVVAIYAAIVATGALALEVRRWFESGPKIFIRAVPNMMVVGDGVEEKDLLAVTAYNRGDQSTTVTHMVLVEYDNLWSRLRDKRSKSYIIPNPQLSGHPPSIPKELPTGGQWMGFARSRPDVVDDIETGKFWAGVHTTSRDRAYLARIRKRKPVPKGDVL